MRTLRSMVPLLACSMLLCLMGWPHAASSGDQRFLELSLSGDPVHEQLIRASIADLISETFPDDGKKKVICNVDGVVVPVALRPGEHAMVEVPVKVLEGGGSRKDKLFVTVKNLGLDAFTEDSLIVSNDPEDISDRSLLVSEELGPGRSARIVYYHKGAEDLGLALNTYLENPDDLPITMFVSKGLGGPSPDGLYSGHVATKRFLLQQNDSAGRVITVPANTTFRVCSQPLKKMGVVSAVMRVKLLTGRKALVRIASEAQGAPPSPSLPNARTNEDGRLAGMIPCADIEITKSFECGAEMADIRIGEEPTFYSMNKGFDIHLGNYGLMHRITLDVSNGSNREKKASLYYLSTGGPARGVFLIDGSLYETGLLDATSNKSERIMSIAMPPRSSRSLHIIMMPQPGSFYPTRLALTN